MFRFVISCSTAVSLTLSAPALAGGNVPDPAPAPMIVSATPDTDWTGAYAGLQFDYLTGTVSGGGSVDVDGQVYGLFGGYRYDFGDFVLGGELDYMMGEFGTSATTLDVDGLLRLGVELGYDTGPALIYGTAGYSWMELSSGGSSADDDGYFYGIGVDYRINERFTVGGEILQHEFDSFGGSSADIDFTTIGINVAYTF